MIVHTFFHSVYYDYLERITLMTFPTTIWHKISNLLKCVALGIFTGSLISTVLEIKLIIYLLLLLIIIFIVLLNYAIRSNNDKSTYLGVFVASHILSFVYGLECNNQLSLTNTTILLLFLILSICIFFIYYGFCATNNLT